MEEMKPKWTDLVSRRNSSREIRYMVTGNILQAFSEFSSGRLVSYTTDSEEIKKGIFLPDSFEERQADIVTVPVARAASLIASMAIGSQFNLSGGISLFKNRENFKMVVPISKTKGGEYYLNGDILAQTAQGKFESVAGKMVANIPSENLISLLDILQHSLNISVKLSQIQYRLIDPLPVVKKREWPKLKLWNKTITNHNKERKLKLLNLKAKAIALELELLNFTA